MSDCIYIFNKNKDKIVKRNMRNLPKYLKDHSYSVNAGTLVAEENLLQD